MYATVSFATQSFKLTSSLEHLTLSGNIIYDLTDHLPNFLIIKKFTSLPDNVKIYKRDYSNFDEFSLIQDIQSVDWEGVLHADPDPNVIFDFFVYQNL